jgi:8-oxo-dGTP pyrophosphatase MutT (NUDIX family)
MTTGRLAQAKLTRIAEAVRSHRPVTASRHTPFFEAAVALVLRPTAKETVEILFIERASRADDPWSGQIAFPGGRHDAGDSSLEATAIRETMEEVALDISRPGAIAGWLDELRPATPVLPPVVVRPFVVTVAENAHAAAQPPEVAALFWAPLDDVLDQSATRETQILVRGTRTLRPAIHYEGRIIWGMTERILRTFEEITS